MTTAGKALARLREGNRRFASGELAGDTRPTHSRVAVSASQAPFAIILGCSDSRVPCELIFGQGLGDLVPNRGSCPATPAGRWGYPCFRPNVLPIILLFTDADMWNGPTANGHTYGNPPFDGTVGLGSLLPPVEQSPNVLYANDPFSAWNIGMAERTPLIRAM